MKFDTGWHLMSNHIWSFIKISTWSIKISVWLQYPSRAGWVWYPCQSSYHHPSLVIVSLPAASSVFLLDQVKLFTSCTGPWLDQKNTRPCWLLWSKLKSVIDTVLLCLFRFYEAMDLYCWNNQLTVGMTRGMDAFTS